VRDRAPSHDPIIGLDATYSIGSELSGVGKYSLYLIDGLARVHPPLALRRYYRPHRWWRAPWPKRLLLDSCPRGINLFHGLNQRLPRRRSVPLVSTFHDLFVLSGEYSTPAFRERFAAQAREAAAASDLIIAVSQFTASQVVEYLSFPAHRIRVVPHGVVPPSTVRPPASREKIVLSVGAVQKRKNTRRLIEAFRALAPDWQLWIAGSAGFEAAEMLAQAPSNVRVLGYVSDAELHSLYQRAAILAFPSLDEGFGIPVLEAMAHGLPVLSSNCSALPEVAGDAALLVDPYSAEAIAEALQRLTDLELRSQLSAQGLARAALFSWQRSADLTAAVYRELL
jgi:glycosyltransferase involved in cell wall biosynthesis